MTETPQFGFALIQDASAVQSSPSSIVKMIPKWLSSSASLENLDRVAADLVADPRRVAAGGRDDPEQRGDALRHRRLEDVVDLARLVRVKLVDDPDVEVLAVERLGLARERDEAAVVRRLEDLVLVDDRADGGAKSRA
jgi:hypothetical protein